MKKTKIACSSGAAAVLLCFAAGTPRVSFAQETDNSVLAEVLVTASKRGEQSIQDTPMAIQAITADQLQEQGIKEFADYARTISGLTFEDAGPGDKKIVIRGLDSTGASTTGLYFDDMVVTSNNSEDGGGRQPDLALVDMERIEVLKGPQGTLYGASSMSGTVLQITNKPDASKVSGSFNVGTGSTDGANGANYNFDATVNVPIVQDVLAIRAVAYENNQQGYIDNKLLGMDGVNNELVKGFRVAARWDIAQDTTLDLMYVNQNTSTMGPAWYQPIFGQFVQSNQSVSPWTDGINAANLAFNWKVAEGTVTATASKMDRNIDYQYPGARILCTVFGGYSPSTCYAFDNSILEGYRSNAFEPQTRDITSSELRYASAWHGPVQLVAGAFYDDEDNNFHSTVYGLNPEQMILPDLADNYSDRIVHNEVEQKAVFGELTYNITDALSVTGGVRAFRFDIDQRSDNLPDISRQIAQSLVYTNSTEQSATYKGNISYKFPNGQLLYFTYSQGFRSGGNNEPDNFTGTVLAPYKSDTVDSYELGDKGRFLGGAVELDTAVYLMDWNNLQQRIEVNIPGSASVPEVANVGAAQITGAEVGLQVKPVADLDLLFGANATVLRDVITTAVQGLNNVGDRVPNVPQFTTDVYADYKFSLMDWQSSARAEYQYVGDSYSEFNKTLPDDTREGDYSLVNFRLSFERDHFRLGAYVDNIFNDIGVITASFDTRTPIEVYSTRPRTVGVTAGYSF
jgi:iron complex outermembrane recepter protein